MTAQEWWDAVRDAAGRIAECEVLKWFFGSRFVCDARPDRCAKCPAHVTAHAAECARRCCSDGEGD